MDGKGTDCAQDYQSPYLVVFNQFDADVDGKLSLAEFTAFQIKIVGQAQNTSIVPLVSALRCMALA